MRRRQLIEACARASDDPDLFGKLCRLIEATVHHQYHERILSLQELYAPVDPNADTVRVAGGVGDAGASKERGGRVPDQQLEQLEEELVGLLEAADFEEISPDDVERAFRESALLRVRIDVNLDAYERVLLYGRGRHRRSETVRRWFGLRQLQVEFTNFDRALVYVRRKPSDPERGDGDEESVADRDRSRVLIKLFRNVPLRDIEMLLPEPEVKMRTVDRLVVGVPAVISGVALIVTKAGPQLLLLGALLAFWLGLRDRQVDLDQQTALAALMVLMALGGYVWRQIDKYRGRKLQFLKDISERLYFKNLDNGAGVFHHLLDEAEDQECREAVLGLFVLHGAGEPLTEEELDRRAEEWLCEQTGVEVDFEHDDALDKLETFGVLRRENGRLSAVPLDEALERMDAAWDAEFDFSSGESSDAPAGGA